MKKMNYGIAVVLILVSAGLIGFVSMSSTPSGTYAQDDGIVLRQVFTEMGFSSPVGIYFLDDQVFVLEKSGTIKVFGNDQMATTSEIFLDITELVSEEGSEMGLLGLAFHPDYEENGEFYIDYTTDSPRRTVIARYTVDSEDENKADPESSEIIFEVEQPYVNHNGGQITFGPDGYLYISMGDGGGGGDPLENAQNVSTVLGAILRIDVDSPDPGMDYGIPDDNPFADSGDSFAKEIYAYGLRNPWRFSFDNETGDLWAADVGQNAIEEIDLIESGNNYGWDIKEGSQCYEPPSGCDDFGLIDPVWEYNHSLGQSVTGGFVYHGTLVSELAGKYIYGDFITGRIWALEYDSEEAVENEELFDTDLQISTFGMDQDGEVYVVGFDGTVYLLDHEDNLTTTTTTTNTPTTGTTTTTAPPDPTLTIVLVAGAAVVVVVLVVYVLNKRQLT